MGLFFLGITAMCAIRPVVMARWVKRAHPDIDENDKTLLWFIRFIGAVGLGMSLVFSMVIIRSLGG
jgi:hypothetical protein